MSIWTRFANALRSDPLDREIDEELQSHIEEAIAQGRDPAEARRAFGSPLRHREESRDARLVAWMASLRADLGFGWRQVRKNKVTSAAAILSLALAIGACASAFRIMDALLWRPMPVVSPERLYSLARHGTNSEGKPSTWDSWEYPLFRQMRAAVKDQAELMAVSFAGRVDLTFGSDQDMEKAYRQHVSGWAFGMLGVRPALGRVLAESDDLKPGTPALAVLSHDYWTRRFRRDPDVVGRTFRMDEKLYEIVGVSEEGFTGTQTGTVSDLFVPTTMNARAVECMGCGWLRVIVWLRPGATVESVQERLRGTFRVFRQDRLKEAPPGIPKVFVDRYLAENLELEGAAAGTSGLQRENRRSFTVLAVLVALVLLMSCGNVANLLTARASARAREMALRVSIGAGRWRLVQLVLAESVWLAFLATALGGLFAWWSAPLVVAMMNPADDPVRLSLPVDFRLVGFGLALALGVTGLFGLLPALRASGVKPVNALKGGQDSHSRRRLMHGLIAGQVAFCVFVLFVAGLLVATFERLSHRPTGFVADGVLAFEGVTAQAIPAATWDEVVDHLRTVPGVEAVALAGWPLLSGNVSNGPISIGGGPVSAEVTAFLGVSPGWMAAMKIRFLEGRDFRPGEVSPGVAIVNEAFAQRYFEGSSPIERSFEKMEGSGRRTAFRIVGVVRNARYVDLREPVLPTAYIPLDSREGKGEVAARRSATFIVRTSSTEPLSLAPTLRREVSRARPELRVSSIRTQVEICQSNIVQERLLAMLALFFAAVALLLAGVGLYGVLHFSVVQRRREIGIRMALGARGGDVTRRVGVEVFSMVLGGVVAGLVLGLASERYIASLFYEVKATDPAMLAIPLLTMLAVALLAALPPVVGATRIDPVTILRAE
jgi:predicted permease